MVAALLLLTATCTLLGKPRVFIFTDINIDSGDPDDRQSLIHLLWYADELQIEGIVPERWNADGYEACNLAIDAYAEDYKTYCFEKHGYPEPSTLKNYIATNLDHATKLFNEAASSSKDPLWVLVWGNMQNVSDMLSKDPELSDKIRLITIGTHLMLEENRKFIPEGWGKTERACEQPNWNGSGRNSVFEDERFNDLWWLEINWTYEGMFTGEEPSLIFEKLLPFGALGAHMEEVVKNQKWARYFRVGDTPSVLYLIDPNHDLNNPNQISWAGQFTQPFPNDRPHYFADDAGSVTWDYHDPCKTWQNHPLVRANAKRTLESKRPKMYEALLKKLSQIYHSN